MAKPSRAKSISLKILVQKEPRLNYSKILGKITGHSRSTVKIKETKTNLLIEINSNDMTAMRASANSILRDLQVIKATDLED